MSNSGLFNSFSNTISNLFKKNTLTVSGIHSDNKCGNMNRSTINLDQYKQVRDFLIKHNGKNVEIILSYACKDKDEDEDKNTITKTGNVNIDISNSDVWYAPNYDPNSHDPYDDVIYKNYNIIFGNGDDNGISIRDILTSNKVTITLIDEPQTPKTGGKQKSNKSNKSKKSKKSKRKTTKRSKK